jgi:hypothetical protein
MSDERGTMSAGRGLTGVRRLVESGVSVKRIRDSHLLRSDVKARQGEPTAHSLQLTASVGYGIRNTPERLAVSR